MIMFITRMFAKHNKTDKKKPSKDHKTSILVYFKERCIMLLIQKKKRRVLGFIKLSSVENDVWKDFEHVHVFAINVQEDQEDHIAVSDKEKSRNRALWKK